ncbi:dynein axonemal assembly factor 8 isoform X2 [Amia ocellicauda]|uniref:dynein axonemal assembly factor 8 isoform X2 n=1 Tax=Amia ocellicauda TaxID=2972642 RepID=UPI00346402A2
MSSDCRSMLARVPACIPALDSDASCGTSDGEEELLVSNRDPAPLLPGSSEESHYLFFEDPELEEQLRGRKPRQCWTEGKSSDRSISDDLAFPLSCVSADAARGERTSSANGDGPEEDLDAEAHGRTVGLRELLRSQSQEELREKPEKVQSNGLSLQLLEQWDLDEALQTLMHRGDTATAEDPAPIAAHTDRARGRAEAGLMERLTALCVKQAIERVEDKEDTLPAAPDSGLNTVSSLHAQDLRNGRWLLKGVESELPRDRRAEAPTVHIDLRDPEPPRHPPTAETLEQSTGPTEPRNHSELTGKSLLLQKLREANRGDTGTAGAVKRHRTGSAKRRKKLRSPTPSGIGGETQLAGPGVKPPAPETQSQPDRPQEGGTGPGESVHPEQTTTVGKKDEEILANRRAEASRDPERREQQQKEAARRQQLHEHLEAFKPQRLAPGRQPTAPATSVLYDVEASYLPSVSPLCPESANRETVLLTVRLSSPGQVTAGTQANGPTLSSAVTGATVYNCLVAWFLSLVGPDPHSCEESAGADGRPPFWVAGLQQLCGGGGLALYVCATSYEEGPPRTRRHRRQEERSSALFPQRVGRFLSQTALSAVVHWAPQLSWLLSRQAHPPHFRPPATRLDSFVSVNPEKEALEKVFGARLGFYWRTLETEDQACESAGDPTSTPHTNPEVAMALAYRMLWQDPLVTHHTLQLLLDASLDVCGLRLLFPPPGLLSASTGGLPPACERDCGPLPVLALAFRGPRASCVWQDLTGPLDPELARVTDPNSINALHCHSRDLPLFYSPRPAVRIQRELCVWFGGRAPKEGVVPVGPQSCGPAPTDRSVPVAPSLSLREDSKRGDQGPSPRDSACLPAALSATVAADIFLLVSPAVPPCCFGDVLSVCCKRGFSLRGLQRLQLSPRRAQGLGLTSRQIPVYCSPPPPYGLSAEDEPPVALPSHCLAVLLRRENALHHCAGLLTGLMSEFAEQGLTGPVNRRLPLNVRLETGSCFHALPYSDRLLHSLGRSMWLVPDCDSVYHSLRSTRSFPSNPEVEQVVVLTLTGADIEGPGAAVLRRVLRGEAAQLGGTAGAVKEGFELLALKWLPVLSDPQACEVSPFEVGDQQWRGSLAALASAPALVCALRRVDAFAFLYRLLQDCGAGLAVMSPTPQLAFRQAAHFFSSRELIPDHSARPLLRFLPPPSRSSRPPAKQPCPDPAQSVFSCMVESPEPLVTVVLFKPGVWRSSPGKILSSVQQAGFCIVGLALLVLGPQAAAALVSGAERQEPGAVAAHVQYLTSGPSLALCLQRENAVKRLLDLLGPEDPLVARAQDPCLWRAHYGTDLLHNGVYGSRSYRSAVRDARMLFPEGLCCRETALMAREQIPCMTSDHSASMQPMNSHRLAHRTTVPSPRTPLARPSGCSALRQTACLLVPSRLLQACPPAPWAELLDQLAQRACRLVGGRLCALDRQQRQRVGEALQPSWESGAVVSGVSEARRDHAVGPQLQKQHLVCRWGPGSGTADPPCPPQSAALSEGPCLILALEGDNTVTCFASVLDSVCWERPELQEARQSLLFPHSERQAALLHSLFPALSPASQHGIEPLPPRLGSRAAEASRSQGHEPYPGQPPTSVL